MSIKTKTEHSLIEPVPAPKLAKVLVSGVAEAEALTKPVPEAEAHVSAADFAAFMKDAGQASKSILSYELQ